MIIHVMGASGSGTTTIGNLIADKFGFDILESDFYKWEQTNPPFQKMRSDEESNKILIDKIKSSKNLVIAGSLHSNPIAFEYIDIIFYLFAPTPVRMARIEKRDVDSGRNSRLAGGEVEKEYLEFLWWVENYDVLGFEGRSRKSQQYVMKNCKNAKTYMIDTDRPIEQIMQEITKILENNFKEKHTFIKNTQDTQKIV